MDQKYSLSLKHIEEYQISLMERECSKNTISKYMRDIRTFYKYLPENKEISKACVVEYKTYLSTNYKGTSANSMLVSINGLFSFLGWQDCRVNLLRVQHSTFREVEKELTKAEYQRLLEAAMKKKDERLNLLLQTICSTGIRVGEVRYITTEALKKGVALVVNKGKERQVLLPEQLVILLRRYCKKQHIFSGSIFITRTGRPLSRGNIWAAMKQLSAAANVDPQKIFPHNLRHLFALTYYRLEKDIVRLADILGHASVDTTRIYTATSNLEYIKSLTRMGLCFSS